MLHHFQLDAVPLRLLRRHLADAARALLELGVKLRESVELEERIANLEAQQQGVSNET